MKRQMDMTVNVCGRVTLSMWTALFSMWLLGGAASAVRAESSAVKVVVYSFQTQTPSFLVYLGPALAEILCSRLAVPGRVTVIEPSEAGQAPVSSETAIDLGRGLGAAYVVMGRVTATAETAGLEASLVPVTAKGKSLQVSLPSMPLSDLLPQTRTLASQLLASIEVGKDTDLQAGTSAVKDVSVPSESGPPVKEEGNVTGRTHPDRFFLDASAGEASSPPPVSTPSTSLPESEDITSQAHASSIGQPQGARPETRGWWGWLHKAPDQHQGMPPIAQTLPYPAPMEEGLQTPGTEHPSPGAMPAPLPSASGPAGPVASDSPETLHPSDASSKSGWFSWLRWPWRSHYDDNAVRPMAHEAPLTPGKAGTDPARPAPSPDAVEGEDFPIWQWQ